MKKKLILAVLMAAALSVPHAEATYYGPRLQAGATYTFRINDAGVGNATTLLAVNRERVEVQAVRAALAAEFVEIPLTVPAKASRIILMVDIRCLDTTPVTCGQVDVTVIDAIGNTVLPPVTVTNVHEELVLDVQP
jgi:hypothetical protein